jgi:E-phenylitaconyl-CoA hydratase
VAILSGAGDRAFSAGADLKEMREAREAGEDFWVPPQARGSIEPELRVYKPVIAAINGHCLGGGLTLALSCDIRIASNNATFGYLEILRGIPTTNGALRLPRAVPLGIALELLLTGDRIDAQEAYRVGLVNRLAPLAELIPTAEAIANKIMDNAPLAVRVTKELAIKGLAMSYEEGLRLGEAMRQIVKGSEDAKEGPRAFAEKRKPIWKGC